MTTNILAESTIVGAPPSPPPARLSNDTSSSGEVRALDAADISTVAAIYHRVFLHGSGPPSPVLTSHLENQFLPNGRSAGSLVYVRGNEVVGFVGSIPLTMSIDGRRAKVAVLTSLMVDDHASDPMGGAKLIRAMVSGPQDITISETASRTSVAMWRSLRGTVLPAYSLDWRKILSPARYIVARAAGRVGMARLMLPVAGGVDRLIAQRAAGPRHWRPFVASEAKDISSLDLTSEEAAASIRELTLGYSAHPVWSETSLERRLGAASVKSLFGPLTCRSVIGRGGRPIGLFLYHGRSGGIGHVLQILSLPNHAGVVVDELFRHAASTGLTALRGRADPMLLDAMLGRDCSFINTATTVAIARDGTLLKPLLAGGAFINGLAGETWSPLIGNNLRR